MKRSYIYVLIFTLLIIGVFAVVFFGFKGLKDSTPAWRREAEDKHQQATSAPETTEKTTVNVIPITPFEPNKPLLRDEPDHKPTVVLDAGHGFGDVGCGGPTTALVSYEYELNMDMVLTLKKELEAEGITVLLTHDGESFPTNQEIIALCEEYSVPYDTTKKSWQDNDVFSPYERTIYMNALDAMYGVDFAFSVHINSNPNSSELNGFELDYCKENLWSQESKVYAEAIRYSLLSEYSGRKLSFFEDSWDDAFVVTKYNSMPSALLETGYYTNAEDCALLRNKGWRDALMKTLAKTISEVLENEYEER